MNHGMGSVLPQRLQNARGALDVRVLCVQRRIKRGLGITLRGKMENVVRDDGGDGCIDGHGVAQIPVDKVDALFGIDGIDPVPNVIQ